MGAAVIITLAFVIGETVAGFLSHSLALLSDAGHNFADALALGISWYAIWISSKPSDPKRTFGYHRVAILAALVNAVSLVVIALIIFWEAVQRLKTPEPIHAGPMISVAAIAICVNCLIAYWLHHGAKKDVNVRSAYLHMIGDAVSALGVVIAGIVITFTKDPLPDVIASFAIAALILWSSWGILKETVHVLLEGSPADINMSALEKTIRDVPGVLNVHDLHVWTVGPGVIACSCHVVVAEQSVHSGQKILREVAEELEEHYEINHTTVQIESESCEFDDMYCRVEPSHHGHGHHHH
ncbi:MAG: hypothetical protein JWM68_3127 [Verrucomicrobiales bacterium]|nr:hypothetical protein [Verrucomicrobiales bacterium]